MKKSVRTRCILYVKRFFFIYFLTRLPGSPTEFPVVYTKIHVLLVRYKTYVLACVFTVREKQAIYRVARRRTRTGKRDNIISRTYLSQYYHRWLMNGGRGKDCTRREKKKRR